MELKRKIGALSALVMLLSGCGADVSASDMDLSEDKELSSEETVENITAEDKPSVMSPDDISEAEMDTDSSEVNESKTEEPQPPREAEECTVGGGYWFTVSDFDKVYSNKELEECFDRLQEICSEANFHMAFSFKNMDTGAYVGYGQYDQFMTCSCVKAPYVKSLLAKGIDLKEKIPLTAKWEGDYEGIVNEEYGKEFTAKKLIEYTILDSDNTAYQLLCLRYGAGDFNNHQYEIGSNYTLGYNAEWIFTYCSSDDMMKDYEDIYRFAKKNKDGKWLIKLLSKAHLNIQIGAALGDKYKVAQKYGSDYEEMAFNDCAIVYADSPFVLCIMTEQYPETEESCKVFKDLALVFDDINSLIAK
ncbi:MAG: serine hydrolase [Ruminococcus sp.]|uniref:serine hydrolase n=1 Tax=Ruminococcus sp. TaxID=41978 RepID=UPI0025E1EA4A|nr:serine hydrolase [Ruminococcus sp.]MBO4867624.1 serine hydrolase [Ruminococcus sp.]